jgi:hypothetical protein
VTTKACALEMRAGEQISLRARLRSVVHLRLDRLLAEMWTAMASGLAIDEQYDARWGSDKATSTPVSVTVSGVSTPLNADGEELDPNDLAPMGLEAAVQPNVQPKSQYTEWDDLSDDDGYYGR